jgi:hypothetical protein
MPHRVFRLRWGSPSRYLERDHELQDMTVAGPERLLAFAIEGRAERGQGHSFAPLKSSSGPFCGQSFIV